VISILGQIINVGDIMVVPQPYFQSAVPAVIVDPGTSITVFGQRLNTIQAASLGPHFLFDSSILKVLTVESSAITVKVNENVRIGNFSFHYSVDGQLFLPSNLTITVEKKPQNTSTLSLHCLGWTIIAI